MAKLTFMVGGVEEEYNAAQELLTCMGANVVYCGQVGTGQVKETMLANTSTEYMFSGFQTSFTPSSNLVFLHLLQLIQRHAFAFKLCW